MERLSGLDASFLYLESGAQLMHVCGLIVVDPGTDPRRLRLRDVQEGAGAAGRGRPDVQPQAQARARWDRLPGVGGRRGVRHRAARPPARRAGARWRARAVRGRRPPRRHPARPVAAALGDVRDRGPGERPARGVLEDAPRVRRRRLGIEHDLLPLQPRARRAAAGLRRRPGRDPHPRPVRPRAGRPRPALDRDEAVAAGPARDADRAHGGRHHQAGRARAPRWPHRSPPRAPRSTAPSPGTGRSRSPTSRSTTSRRSRTRSRAPPSTTWCWR